MSTSGRIHGVLLRLIFFLSNGRRVFCGPWLSAAQTRVFGRGVFVQQTRGTIGFACAQDVALRGDPTTARCHVAAHRDLPPLYMAYDDHDRNVSHIHGFAKDM
jgi:hypothetical protein